MRSFRSSSTPSAASGPHRGDSDDLPTPPCPPERELVFAGIARQAERVAAGDISPRELVEACLARIERLDPELNAFRVVLAEHALAEADQAAERLTRGETSPLLGVPIAVKDDVDVAGETTRLGTRASTDVAVTDSDVVRRLRAAGAIIIGKTHLPELLMWPVTESAHSGPTRNPWAPTRTPGGSSGGSAVAVAAGMVGAAVGSDGGGSIRIPAACCGIFGIKPQRDRISLAPKREHWYGLSTYGPLTRHVRDAALFLDVTAPQARGDAFSAAAKQKPEKLRIAVSTRFPPGIGALVPHLHSEMRHAVEEVARTLRSLGHDIVSRDPAYGTIAADEVVRYLAGIREDASRLTHPELLEPRSRTMLRAGAAVRPKLLERSRSRELNHIERLAPLFAECHILLTPALACPPIEITATNGRGAFRTVIKSAPLAVYTTPWNVTGQPAAVVPAGLTADGLPLSVQLVGRPHDEMTLLSLAAQLEAELEWPQLTPPAA